MILFFDTETTGLPVFGTPLDNPAQPYVVQAGAHDALVDVRACARLYFRLRAEMEAVAS